MYNSNLVLKIKFLYSILYVQVVKKGFGIWSPLKKRPILNYQEMNLRSFFQFWNKWIEDQNF